jgi:GMP synthase-like glutamine amidotransferase
MVDRKEKPMTDRPGPTRLAIIDNSIFPEIYNPVEHWSPTLPVDWEAFPARDHRFPDPARFSHLLLTGSEASILEPDPWVAEEVEVVLEAVRRGLAVLGSCWGHQLLAYALAGPGSVGRCTRPEIGWIRLHIDKDSGLLGPAGGEPWTFSLHFDEVLGLDDSFEVLASTDLCRIQVMRLRDRPVWGLQCHPEIGVATARKFLRDLADRGFKGRASLLEALASPARDSGLVRRIAGAFLGLRVPPGKGLFRLTNNPKFNK